jgi:8-oxo-dGTP diphosphatase
MLSVRARVIIIREDTIALIERQRSGRCYYIFPGGGVEPGETLEEAAVREAAEELGLVVTIGRHVAEAVYQTYILHFFLATPIGGTFGTGHGPEMNGHTTAEQGIYRAVWLPLDALLTVEVLPGSVARLIAQSRANAWAWPAGVVSLLDSPP